MIKREDVFRIGRLGKPHGVKGEISFLFDDDVFDRVDADYLVIDTDGILVPFFMESYRFRSDSVALVKFCDVDTADQARELTGNEVFFPRSLSDEQEGVLSWNELVGFSLHDEHGKLVGTIVNVDDSTVNVLFETDSGKLIPANPELITHVDSDTHTITINLPEGILDL